MDSSLDRIVFIGGSGRSGTSITREILGSHSQVASLPFEYRFIIDPDGIVDFYCSYSSSWSPYMADRRIKRLERFLLNLATKTEYSEIDYQVLNSMDPDGDFITLSSYIDWELAEHLPHYIEHTKRLIANLRGFDFSASWVGSASHGRNTFLYHSGPKSREDLSPILGGYIQAIIRDYLEEQEKRYFVEDNTWNILFAQELLELIPNSKIIHIFRDPRDVVSSFVQQRWAPSDVEQAAIWYLAIMDYWFEIRNRLSSEDFYEISLEELVDEPEESLRDMCQFIDLPFEEIMLETDLSRSNRGRWKSELTKEEKEQVQDILGGVISKLGYV